MNDGDLSPEKLRAALGTSRLGQPFEYLESYFRGDRYLFYAELQNEQVKVQTLQG